MCNTIFVFPRFGSAMCTNMTQSFHAFCPNDSYNRSDYGSSRCSQSSSTYCGSYTKSSFYLIPSMD